jgi:predicted aspartyl protease
MRDGDAPAVHVTAGCTRRYALHVLGGLAALRYSSAGARAETPLGLDVPFPDQGSWYPLNLTHNYLTLPTYVNGQRVIAVVDSGATRSVIREDLAKRFGLSLRGPIAAAAVTENVVGSSYEVDEMRIGSMSAHDLTVASYDMAQLEASIDHAIPLVLGQDVLRLAQLEIQFSKNRIGFGADIDPQTSRSFELIGTGRGYPSLGTRFEGGVSAPAFIDLGSNVICSMSKAFAEAHGFLSGRPVSTTLTVGADGPHESPIFCLGDVEIGPFTLRDIPTSVLDHWMFESPVSFGWPLFVGFDFGLDLAGQRLKLAVETPSKLKAFPKDRSGLGASRESHRIVIRHVATSSPAEKAGLRVGDVVVGIDGRAIDASYPPPGQRQGFQPAGTLVDLQMQDGREVRLLLADYF